MSTNSKRPSVYLSGPMSGLTGPQMTEWRRPVASMLEAAGHIVRDPTRGMPFADQPVPLDKDYAKTGTANNHAAFSRDKFDTLSADILLVNLLGATKVSIGTVMEMAWAHLTGKFVVTVMEPEENLHDHAFVREVSAVVLDTVDAAVDYILKAFK